MPETLQIDSRLDELEAKLAAKKADLNDLAMMGAVITSIFEIEKVLSVVMEMALGLVRGEVGLIMLVEENQLTTKISWGLKDDLIATLKYKDDLDLATYCYKHQETVILNDLDIVDDNGRKIDSIVCLPIKSGGTVHGIITIINKADHSPFDSEDREILSLLMNFVAVAIDNSRLLSVKLEQQKLTQEFDIARQIQETILPQNIDNIGGAEIGAVYFPHRAVGGDFYNIVRLDDNCFVVVLGDVSNKGVPAALIMSAAAGTIETILETWPDIAINELASYLNDLLVSKIIKDRDMFATLFFCKFDLANKKLTYCNAGHLPGLFWSEAEQKVEELSLGGPIVGQFAGLEFKLGERKLESGDRLFLFTDGLTEAADDEGRLFGRERAEQVFTAEIDLSPNEFCTKVKEWVDRFTVGSAEETHDDFTIMQVRVK